MKRTLRLSALLLTVLVLITSLVSCSYGFLNFSTETGRIEISFEFMNINALDVDNLVYELTSPGGQSVAASIGQSYDFGYYSLDRTDIGTWHIKGELYSGDTLIQGFDYDITVVSGSTTKLSVQAFYQSGSYEIIYSTWQYDENGGGTTSYIPEQPDFIVDEMRIMPAVYRLYRSGDQRYSANVRLLGSSLVDNVQGLELTWPDGAVYEYGDMYAAPRAVEVYDFSDNGMLEFNRPFNYEDNRLNGTYRVELTDHKGVSDKRENMLDLDYDALMPSITNAAIPTSFTTSDSYDFYYDFGTASGTGTKLVFFVNQNTNAIYPPDDSIAVSATSGVLQLLPAMLTMGSWEVIVAAIEYATTTPVTDATALGLSPDLGSDTFVDSVYELYGADTGFILYTGVAFQVN